MTAKEFCTCTDHKCPLNPINHDRGCELCVAKCLQLNEIPSCFFKKVSSEKPDGNIYTFQSFANFVNKHSK